MAPVSLLNGHLNVPACNISASLQLQTEMKPPF